MLNHLILFPKQFNAVGTILWYILKDHRWWFSVIQRVILTEMAYKTEYEHWIYWDWSIS